MTPLGILIIQSCAAIYLVFIASGIDYIEIIDREKAKEIINKLV